jgi:glycosyltransferase involved in cell wall biosynthesis
MRILHVGWGFRPWRGGGLIAYAEDVMDAQAARGDEVAYFFGGRRYPFVRRPRLHRWRRRGVAMLEVLSSPIPVGVENGTRFPGLDLDEPATERLWERALAGFRPDIVSLQELLGVPSSIVDIAHAHGMPVVMTLHDYFPLCPTARLFDADGQTCTRSDPAPQCVRCCTAAPLGTRHIREMTTAFELQRAGRALPWAREPARRALAAVVREMPTGLPLDTRARRSGRPPAAEDEYRRRRGENLERLARIDLLIAGSSRTAEIYARFGVPRERLRVLHGTTGHLARLTARTIDAVPRPVRFATLAGAQSDGKGASVLLDAARRLQAERPAGEYVLDVHGLVGEGLGGEFERLPSVRLHGPYGRADLGAILDRVDVGLVPSLWEDVYPTVGLEFLAAGVPLIASDRGGLPEYTIPGETGWLNRSCTAEELAEIMAGVVRDPAQVVDLNRSIRARRDELLKTHGRHLEELDAVYAEVVA